MDKPHVQRDVDPKCAKPTISHRGLIFLTFKNLCCGTLRLLRIPAHLCANTFREKKYQNQGKAHNWHTNASDSFTS